MNVGDVYYHAWCGDADQGGPLVDLDEWVIRTIRRRPVRRLARFFEAPPGDQIVYACIRNEYTFRKSGKARNAPFAWVPYIPRVYRQSWHLGASLPNGWARTKSAAVLNERRRIQRVIQAGERGMSQAEFAHLERCAARLLTMYNKLKSQGL